MSRTEHGVFERHVNDNFEIVASGRPALGLCAAEATSSEGALATEERFEDVAEARRIAETATAGSGLAEAVVVGATFIVAERFVGLGDFLEPRFGLVVAGIAVGMQLASELAVRLLDLVGRGRAIDAEQFVIVSHGYPRVRCSPSLIGDHCHRSERLRIISCG